uniref:Proteasome subunit beta type-6 n=1 Tax=Schistocephalus solidus TaxID=70667 RepID=A0A0X3NZX9_SCHSO
MSLLSTPSDEIIPRRMHPPLDPSLFIAKPTPARSSRVGTDDNAAVKLASHQSGSSANFTLFPVWIQFTGRHGRNGTLSRQVHPGYKGSGLPTKVAAYSV